MDETKSENTGAPASVDVAAIVRQAI